MEPTENEDEVTATDEEKQLAADYVAELEADPDDSAEKPSEAAKYRRRLRDTEKERDVLAAQLDSMRRAEIGRLATTGDGPRLHDAEDLQRHGVDLGTLISEDGTVDAAAVGRVVEDMSRDRPHLRADLRERRGDVSQGRGGEERQPASASWAGVLDLGTPQ